MFQPDATQVLLPSPHPLPPDPLPSDPLDRPGLALLRLALRRTQAGRIAAVSSFGAESAVLLALVAEIDPATPVLFLQTGRHFAETLEYRSALARRLGLTDVRDVEPASRTIDRLDPEGLLAGIDPDRCCGLRKVQPLEAALAPFAAWVTGRKRYQAATRTRLAYSEQESGRVKLNPLADWTAAEIAAEHRRRGLPAHPLVRHGFRSIGCAPCTRPVDAAEDSRAGRWAGQIKTECGIHRHSSGESAVAA